MITSTDSRVCSPRMAQSRLWRRATVCFDSKRIQEEQLKRIASLQRPEMSYQEMLTRKHPRKGAAEHPTSHRHLSPAFSNADVAILPIILSRKLSDWKRECCTRLPVASCVTLVMSFLPSLVLYRFFSISSYHLKLRDLVFVPLASHVSHTS